MRRALIDTNIYSLAMRGDPSVLERIHGEGQEDQP